MSDSFFAFSGEGGNKQKKIIAKRGDPHFNALSFVASALPKKPDSTRHWLDFIYRYEIEDKMMLVATDGRRLHYAPVGNAIGQNESGNTVLYEDVEFWRVEKLSKSEIIMVEQPKSHETKLADFARLFVPKHKMLTADPFKAYRWGGGFYDYKLEFMLAYLGKLMGHQVLYNTRYLLDFCDYTESSGDIQIWCNPIVTYPMRAEHCQYHGELIYGMIFTSMAMFDEIAALKCVYKETEKKEGESEGETAEGSENDNQAGDTADE